MAVPSMIFLDFDGVIFDTAYEAYLVSLITHGYASDLKAAKEFEHSGEFSYGWFLSNRYKVGPAWNYYYLFRGGYDGRKLPETEAVNFQRRFFAAREALRVQDYDEWLKLNKPYACTKYFIELLNTYPNGVAVVTTKDRTTVETLLRINGLRAPLRIYASDAFDVHGNKGQIIKTVIEQEAIASAVFVDDSQEHIDTCSEVSGLVCVRACWGYVEPENSRDNMAEVQNLINQQMGF